MASLVEEIAKFATQVRFENLPPEAIYETKRMLLDTVGCAIAGLSTDKGKSSIQVARRMAGPGEATMLSINLILAAGRCMEG